MIMFASCISYFKVPIDPDSLKGVISPQKAGGINEIAELQTAHGGTFTWWKQTCYSERALKTRLYCNFQYGRHTYGTEYGTQLLFNYLCSK